METAWTLLRRVLREDNPLVPGAIGLGVANAAFASMSIVNDVTRTLDLREMGVPTDASVLNIYLTPQSSHAGGMLAPATITQSFARGPVPHIVHLFGRPLGGAPDVTDVNIMCIWLSTEVEPEVRPLVSAIEAFSNGEYRQAILPATVAVEDKLSAVMASHYSQFGGNQKLQTFLSAATFGHQLNFLMPSLMAFVKAPPLTKEVREQLLDLKSLRDQVAHQHRQVDRMKAADVLLGALFGYRYLRLYGPRLNAINDTVED